MRPQPRRAKAAEEGAQEATLPRQATRQQPRMHRQTRMARKGKTTKYQFHHEATAATAGRAGAAQGIPGETGEVGAEATHPTEDAIPPTVDPEVQRAKPRGRQEGCEKELRNSRKSGGSVRCATA